MCSVFDELCGVGRRRAYYECVSISCFLRTSDTCSAERVCKHVVSLLIVLAIKEKGGALKRPIHVPDFGRKRHKYTPNDILRAALPSFVWNDVVAAWAFDPKRQKCKSLGPTDTRSSCSRRRRSGSQRPSTHAQFLGLTIADDTNSALLCVHRKSQKVAVPAKSVAATGKRSRDPELGAVNKKAKATTTDDDTSQSTTTVDEKCAVCGVLESQVPAGTEWVFCDTGRHSVMKTCDANIKTRGHVTCTQCDSDDRKAVAARRAVVSAPIIGKRVRKSRKVDD